MAKNANLHTAKAAKNDEFYTQYEDIQKELNYYKSFFKDKIVYCNCETFCQKDNNGNDRVSEFWNFFTNHFEDFGLKRLVSTSFNENGHGKMWVYEGDKNGNNEVDEWEIIKTELNGNGDFRSEECVEILKQCDVVVTNPPFSLFREYVALLMEYNKKFLIIGAKNAITYKEIFPHIKENKIWIGCKSMSGSMWYTCPNGYKDKNSKLINGVWLTPIATCWFTNINHPKRSYPLDLYKHYSNESYPKYDNYDAIECSKTTDIPMDYDGVIGVPITFLDKYCPTQFEILGHEHDLNGNGGTETLKQFEVNGKSVYKRILIRKK